MTDSRQDHRDHVAWYLATGEDPGVTDHERGQLDRVRVLLADDAVWANPAPELADVVVARLEAIPPLHVEHRRHAKPWLRPVAVGALAAVLLVVVGLAFAGQLGTSGGTDREAALTGTDLAPDATATASIREAPVGTAISLDVNGLAPVPAGYFYQASLTGPTGRVAIGTFHLRGGDGTIELWSGVDVADYPTITVTIEAEDENQAPTIGPDDGASPSSGQAVLTGTLAEVTP